MPGIFLFLVFPSFYSLFKGMIRFHQDLEPLLCYRFNSRILAHKKTDENDFMAKDSFED